MFSMFWFILFGWLSDRVGRKGPIVIGYALTIVLMFPLFHWMAAAANPELAAAMAQQSGGRHRQRLQLRAVRQGPADRMRQGARRPVEEGHRLFHRRGRPRALRRQSRSAAVPVDASDPASLDAGSDGRRLQAREEPPELLQALQVVLAIVVIGLCRE